MSHQVVIDYRAIAIRCESICEVAEKQINELDEEIARLERKSSTLQNEYTKALVKEINKERNDFHRRTEELLLRAREVSKMGKVSGDSDRLKNNPSYKIEGIAAELQKQVNDMASKRVVEMRALLQKLLSESIENGHHRLVNKASGVVVLPDDIKNLLDGIEDAVARQFTYLAYLNDDTLKGDDLIKAGAELKNESYETRVEKEREKIRHELESAKIEKSTVEKVLAQDRPLEEIRAEATEEIVGEKVRQKSLKIIMSAIAERGFIVDKKNIKIKRDTNEVILVAMKASGEKAEFRVFLDGKFIYDFRGYEGQACQKDIQPFLQDLEEVYGIRITKSQEIWSNPDKISTMKYQTFNTNKNKR